MPLLVIGQTITGIQLSIIFASISVIGLQRYSLERMKIREANYIMFSVIVIIFEAVVVLFIAIFARTNSTTSLASTATNYSFFADGLTLLLAFTLMYSPYRKFSLFSLVVLLMVISVAAQTNILFGTFWDSCFNGFSSSFNIDITLLLRSMFASLAVLLTVLDFIGLFNYWQVYLLIAPIMTIGYSLNSSLLIYGLKVFDGGGGLAIFLYSGVCSLMIWVLTVRGKIDTSRYRIKQSYISITLSYIGVVVAFIVWPLFNMGGALISYINANTTTITSAAYLQNSALANTFLGLAVTVLMSMLLASKDSKEEKLRYKIYVDCFINGGIVMASFQDVSMDPVTCMLLCACSTLITLLVSKYLVVPAQAQAETSFLAHYSKILYRILFPFLGIIICSIVVAARDGKNPSLLSGNYSRTAGLQIVGYILVAIFGAIFGGITAVVINVYLSSREKQQPEIKAEDKAAKLEEICDNKFFTDLSEEIYPLYYDLFGNLPPPQKQQEKIDIAEYSSRMVKDALLGSQDNPLKSKLRDASNETKNPAKDKNEPKLFMQKDYSKSAFKDMDVSQLKVKQKPRGGEPIEREERPLQKQPGRPPALSQPANNSVLKITDSELPPKKGDNVKRKLNYDDFGSQIEKQQMPASSVRH